MEGKKEFTSVRCKKKTKKVAKSESSDLKISDGCTNSLQPGSLADKPAEISKSKRRRLRKRLNVLQSPNPPLQSIQQSCCDSELNSLNARCAEKDSVGDDGFHLLNSEGQSDERLLNTGQESDSAGIEEDRGGGVITEMSSSSKNRSPKNVSPTKGAKTEMKRVDEKSSPSGKPTLVLASGPVVKKDQDRSRIVAERKMKKQAKSVIKNGKMAVEHASSVLRKCDVGEQIESGMGGTDISCKTAVNVVKIVHGGDQSVDDVAVEELRVNALIKQETTAKIATNAGRLDTNSEESYDVTDGEVRSRSSHHEMTASSGGFVTHGASSKTGVEGKSEDFIGVKVSQPQYDQGRSKVLAEREAKKQAKLAAKVNKKIVADTGVGKLGETKHEGLALHDRFITIPNQTVIPNACSLSVFLKSQAQTPASIAVDGDSGFLTGPNLTTLQNCQDGDKILAEREVKTKAKSEGKVVAFEESRVAQEGDAPKTAQSQSSPQKTFPSDKTADGKVETKAEKSKSELRGERRAKQEAQRAAKAAEKQPKTSKQNEAAKENKKPAVKESKKPGAKSANTIATVPLRKQDSKKVKKIVDPGMNSLRLFSHLHYKTKPPVTLASSNIHPAVIELGVKYASRVVFGSNARCLAFLHVLKQLIWDYTTPKEKDFGRGLETQLGMSMSYLNERRPLSVSMTNALRHIKTHLTQLPNNIQDDEARTKLCDVIDTFTRDQIEVAGEAICKSVKEKIAKDDVILIYACSSLLYRILVESHKEGTKFSVVVVDSAPWFEGREMLRRLVSQGLNCTYVLINAISFIMRQATKVLLGAHALLANGYVMSRAGCSLVALVAHSYNVPVLVCCETYKFCERVQTDSFVFNELGTLEDVAPPGSLLWQNRILHCLSSLSILYDVTPPDLVTAVVTEVAILPCTSVPVILRIRPSDIPS